MQLTTILHRLHPCKGFCYQEACFRERSGGGSEIEVKVRARRNSRAVCSGCGQKRAGYDQVRQTRRYQFVPLWKVPVVLWYRPRRVECPECGVKVERVPWAEGKQTQCLVYVWYLAFWAKLLPWSQVGSLYRTSWNTVAWCVQTAVCWGLLHRSLEGIRSIGVDEVQWQRGHHYVTLVYQIDEGQKRLLHVEPERTKASLVSFFRMLGKERSQALEFAASDMWGPYLDVIDRYSLATNVLDRFHVMKKFNEAIDEIRRQSQREASAAGYASVLKGSRWVLLKNPENLTERQVVKLKELLKYNLPVVKAYLLREEFQKYWQYKQRKWARRFLKAWIAQVRRTDLEPLHKVAKMLESHEELLLNWFDAKGQISSGCVEGMNYKVKWGMRKAYGYKSLEMLKTVLYHQLGELPQRQFTHSFC